jgi:cysteine synthase
MEATAVATAVAMAAATAFRGLRLIQIRFSEIEK